VIKSFSAFTHEVDDVDVAVSEIAAQLDFKGKNHLLKNSIGIVSCFAGFIESGVWEAVAKTLPFELFGTTTILNASSGEIGETMFTILVLTSDDVFFSSALSEPISAQSAEPLEKMYQHALAKLPNPDSEKSSFMLSFSPLFSKISCSFYVESMSKISGNVPNFGIITVDHNSDYHESYVLSNGKYWKDRFAVILFQGSVSPSFFIGNISDEKRFSEKGIITCAENNILKMINGKPAIEFLASIGLTKNKDGIIEGINSFPTIVDYNDGTPPIAQAMLALTPEDYVVCGDKVAEGATLSIGFFDPDELVTTANRTLKNALAEKNIHTMLIFSCIGRYFALGYDPLKEWENVQEKLHNSDIHYIASYAGGEICPVYDEHKKTVNRNHGNTFIICAF
jgi:hypothetical protein